jgi:hypothetical protein
VQVFDTFAMKGGSFIEKSEVLRLAKAERQGATGTANPNNPPHIVALPLSVLLRRRLVGREERETSEHEMRGQQQ